MFFTSQFYPTSQLRFIASSKTKAFERCNSPAIRFQNLLLCSEARKLVACGGHDNTIKLWPLPEASSTCKCVRQYAVSIGLIVFVGDQSRLLGFR